MGFKVHDNGKLGLIDVAVMLYQQKKVMFLCFCFSLVVFSVLIWLKPLRYDFYSVYEVGARGLDVALDRPELLVEQVQEIYLPKVLAAVRREESLGHNYSGLQVQVLYKVGSSLIKLYTQAPLGRETDVHALHSEILQKALEAHQKRLAHIEKALVMRRASLMDVVASGKGGLSRSKLAEKKYELVSVEIQLANLSASSLGPIAVSSLKQTMFGRGELFGFALFFCALLGLLSGVIAIFIMAVRARLDSFRSAE